MLYIHIYNNTENIFLRINSFIVRHSFNGHGEVTQVKFKANKAPNQSLYGMHDTLSAAHRTVVADTECLLTVVPTVTLTETRVRLRLRVSPYWVSR